MMIMMMMMMPTGMRMYVIASREAVKRISRSFEETPVKSTLEYVISSAVTFVSSLRFLSSVSLVRRIGLEQSRNARD